MESPSSPSPGRVSSPQQHSGASTGAFARPTLSPLRSRKPAPSAGASSSNRSSESPVASRSVPRHRRGSIISLASDLSVESLRSSTDDLFLPRASRNASQFNSHHGGSHDDEHSSHLQSLPLLLAIVPAIVGIFFQNGTAVMTDLTLLGMAAIFLNWSIRIPWNWYHAAQAVRHHDSINTEDFLPPGDGYIDDDTIVEEDEDSGAEGERDNNSASGDYAAPTSPPATAQSPTRPFPTPKQPVGASSAQLAAANSLRRHEILALIACFLGPILGAGLLHGIRAQLSRPSEGLVSDYNLTIFLLAAEIRPLSHLIKLIQNRTLHLQRIVATSRPSHATDTGDAAAASNELLAAISSRLAALEGRDIDGQGENQAVGDEGEMVRVEKAAAAAANAAVQVPSKEQLVSDVRRAMQPDIDALNRAVRRYEKRATLLSIQIDGRLHALEDRVADSIALAAAAERSVSSGLKRGSAATLLDWAASFVVFPVKTAKWVVRRILDVPRWLLGLAGEIIDLVKGTKADRRGEGDSRRRTSKKADREALGAGSKGKAKRVA